MTRPKNALKNSFFPAAPLALCMALAACAGPQKAGEPLINYQTADGFVVAAPAAPKTAATITAQSPNIFTAIRDCDLPKIEEFLQSGDKSPKNELLKEAVWHNCLGGAQLFIEQGANVNAAGKDKRTLLMTAASYLRFETVKFLVQNNAKVNAKDADGRTALHGAAYEGKLEVVQYLVEHGAKVDEKIKRYKTTPYNAAMDRKHAAVADYLAQQGANPDNKEDYGTTWRDYRDGFLAIITFPFWYIHMQIYGS